MSNGVPAQQPQLGKDVYGFFVGQIDQAAVQRIANALTIASNSGVERIHLLFQSAGGMVGDGVCLYNIFRFCAMDIHLYNVGSVVSIAVIAYLGADERKATANATFMIHKTYLSPVGATAGRLQSAADTALIDDRRVEAILHAHITLAQDKWDIHNVADLWLPVDEAKTAGLVTEIVEFSPPIGLQLFYLGAP